MKPETRRVATWLQPEEIHLDVPLADAAQALQYVAAAVGARHGLEVAPIFRALSRREQAGSTALGAGFAIPHARIHGIERPLTVLVRACRPIPFKAPDQEPVSLLLAILVPERGDRDDHLHLLALVAELFSAPRLRAQMDTGDDPAVLAEALRVGIAGLDGPDRPGHRGTKPWSTPACHRRPPATAGAAGAATIPARSNSRTSNGTTR